MLQGFRTVTIVVAVSTVIGALFGVLLGALTEQYLLWIGVSAVLGGVIGIGFGYGFLPESEADA